MLRPNKNTFLNGATQYDYDEKLREYYLALEKYIDFLESTLNKK